jgi:hypothetical protein
MGSGGTLGGSGPQKANHSLGTEELTEEIIDKVKRSPGPLASTRRRTTCASSAVRRLTSDRARLPSDREGSIT